MAEPKQRFREVGEYSRDELIRDLKDLQREFDVLKAGAITEQRVVSIVKTVTGSSGRGSSSPPPAPFPNYKLGWMPLGGEPGQYLGKLIVDDYSAEWRTITKAEVGLGNVDNTSDELKPLSFVGRLLRDGRDYGWIDADYGLVTDSVDSVMDFGEIS